MLVLAVLLWAGAGLGADPLMFLVPVQTHSCGCEDLPHYREIETQAANKGICMWMLWKLLQSGLACSTGVKKVDVIVLDLVGIVCMTQAGQAAGVLGLYDTG